MDDPTLLSWIDRGQNIAALLVAIGVAAEFVLGFMAVPARHRLDQAKDAEIIGLKDKSAGFEKEAAQLRKDAAQLQKDAEDERLARIQLAASISWRTPDRALAPQLAPPLRQFAGQRFTIVSDLGDPERMNVFTWINLLLLGEAHWTFETARSTSELTFQATNIVLWVSPNAPNGVLEAARALVPVMERGGLPAVVLKSGWGPEPDAAPPEVIRVVIFKKGPRMTVTGNLITFEGLPTRMFFGPGPPH